SRSCAVDRNKPAGEGDSPAGLPIFRIGPALYEVLEKRGRAALGSLFDAPQYTTKFSNVKCAGQERLSAVSPRSERGKAVGDKRSDESHPGYAENADCSPPSQQEAGAHQGLQSDRGTTAVSRAEW